MYTDSLKHKPMTDSPWLAIYDNYGFNRCSPKCYPYNPSPAPSLKHTYSAGTCIALCHLRTPCPIWLTACDSNTRDWVHLYLATDILCFFSIMRSSWDSSLYSTSLPYLPLKIPPVVMKELQRKFRWVYGTKVESGIILSLVWILKTHTNFTQRTVRVAFEQMLQKWRILARIIQHKLEGHAASLPRTVYMH